MNYLRIIHRILTPGGVWINLGRISFSRPPRLYFTGVGIGPLLWHFENNNTNDPSVELDLEEVQSLARSIGFELSVRFHRLSNRSLYLMWFYFFREIRIRTKGLSTRHTQAIQRGCWATYTTLPFGLRRESINWVITYDSCRHKNNPSSGSDVNP